MHKPVMLQEVIEGLRPCLGQDFIDCTIGLGGHSLALAGKIGESGRILGLDIDAVSLAVLQKKLDSQQIKNIFLRPGNFADLRKIVAANGFAKVNGILFDLGFSSWQLEKAGRGFSFRANESLDMRLNPSQELTARQIVNHWSEKSLADILFGFGQEKWAKRIAKNIVACREKKQIKTSADLVDIIRQAVPGFYRTGRSHCSRRTFQALRMAVNNELDNLEQGLNQAMELLKPDARLAVISFHSLEDRIVKRFFKKQELAGKLTILTKKPLIPSQSEQQDNPRARAAKLRIIIKN